MRQLAGQAARHTGRVLHAAGQLALALVLLVAVGIGALSWRLSRGPLDLPGLAPRLVAAANADQPIRLTLGSAALAWEGFRSGLDRPLDIRLSDITVADRDGRGILVLPRAEVSLSLPGLLVGRILPRAIVVDGARVRVQRAADGTLALDLGNGAEATPPASDTLTPLLRQFGGRPQSDRASAAQDAGAWRWSQLREVRIRDAVVSVDDRALGADWELRALDVALRRPAEGGVNAQAHTAVALGALSAQATVQARLAPDGATTDVEAKLTAFNPASVAQVWPAAAKLAALDAPVTLAGHAGLGSDLAVQHFDAEADFGPGMLHIGQGSAPILQARLTASGTPQRLNAVLERLVTAPQPDGPRTTLSGKVAAERAADGRVLTTATVDLDQVAFADLGQLWPEGVGGPGTRPWIVPNITDGVVRNGHVELALELPPDLSDATITRIAGGLDGEDVAVHWLRPVPPISHGTVRLNFLTPDSLELLVSAGREVMTGEPGLTLRNGRIVFSGLAGKDQFADIDSDLAGSVPDLLALLNHPRIKLLQRSSLKIADAGGQFAGHLAVTRLPLRDDMTLDDLQIATTAKLSGLRLGAVAAGRDLDHGTFDLRADPTGLHAQGKAALAGVPAQLQLDMDFQSGPPAQVQQTLVVDATLDDRQLAGLGVDAGEALRGSLGLHGRAIARRNHQGEITLNADLTPATLGFAPLSYAKPAGVPASLAARVLLDHDRVTGIDGVRAEGEDLHIRGSARFSDGKPALLTFDTLVVGRWTNAHGEVRPPSGPGAPWRVTLQGASIDASSLLKHEPPPSSPPPPKPPTAERGPAYAVDARFDHVVLGEGRSLDGVVAHAQSDGEVMDRLDVSGRTQQSAPFRLAIEPLPAGPRRGRQLTGSSADAGGLLRALGVVPDMRGGTLTLTGSYDDTSADHPLSGTARIDTFRVQRAPVLARLLKAMTLYGLVDLVQGPGLGFGQLVAPFRLANDMLDLNNARAFSASLGMTGKGRYDLVRQEFDMQGTIVPAYFFNTLLGDLPIIGRLFSPERGGGVFAATYTVRGSLDDPRVSVNPLAALTPGILRGLFGLFDGAGAAPVPDRLPRSGSAQR
jgi:hypothetical protein